MVVCGGFGGNLGSGCTGFRGGSVSKMLNFPCLAVHGFGIELSFTTKGFGQPLLVCVSERIDGGGFSNAPDDVLAECCAVATATE